MSDVKSAEALKEKVERDALLNVVWEVECTILSLKESEVILSAFASATNMARASTRKTPTHVPSFLWFIIFVSFLSALPLSGLRGASARLLFVLCDGF